MLDIVIFFRLLLIIYITVVIFSVILLSCSPSNKITAIKGRVVAERILPIDWPQYLDDGGRIEHENGSFFLIGYLGDDSISVSYWHDSLMLGWQKALRRKQMEIVDHEHSYSIKGKLYLFTNFDESQTGIVYNVKTLDANAGTLLDEQMLMKKAPDEQVVRLNGTPLFVYYNTQGEPPRIHAIPAPDRQSFLLYTFKQLSDSSQHRLKFWLYERDLKLILHDSANIRFDHHNEILNAVALANAATIVLNYIEYESGKTRIVKYESRSGRQSELACQMPLKRPLETIGCARFAISPTGVCYLGVGLENQNQLTSMALLRYDIETMNAYASKMDLDRDSLGARTKDNVFAFPQLYDLLFSRDGEHIMLAFEEVSLIDGNFTEMRQSTTNGQTDTYFAFGSDYLIGGDLLFVGFSARDLSTKWQKAIHKYTYVSSRITPYLTGFWRLTLLNRLECFYATQTRESGGAMAVHIAELDIRNGKLLTPEKESLIFILGDGKRSSTLFVPWISSQGKNRSDSFCFVRTSGLLSAEPVIVQVQW